MKQAVCRFSTDSLKAERVLLLLLSGLIAVACLGCGRKGPPKPPEAYAPPPVEGLGVEGKIEGLNFTWKAPEVENSTSEIDPIVLGGFVVERVEYNREEKGELVPLAFVPLNADATVKDYTYLDKEVQPGKTYDYAIVPQSDDGNIGEPKQVLRVTFVGANSKVERLGIAAREELFRDHADED